MGRSISVGKVFYELTANTQGLERELKGAEKSLGRFSAYVKANPAAAAGALGVALLGIAAKATEMAEGVDKAFRKVGALVPDLANNLKRAQRGVAELAVVTGKSQEQLLQEAEAIARGGVDGTDDLLNRLRVLQDLADATGGDVATLANGLDQALDVFGLAADQAGEVTAKLFAISQGKAPIEDLFAALQAAAPGIRQLGLDFDTAAAALGTLLNQGLSAKQAGAALKEMAGQGEVGAAKLRELAGAGVDTAEAFKQLAEADRLVRESASRSAASLRQGFNNELIELGTTILPLVNKGLSLTVKLLQGLTGRRGELAAIAKVTTVGELGQQLATGQSLNADEVKQFARAIQDVRGAILLGRLDLAALSKVELQQLSQAFEQFGKVKGQVYAIDEGIRKQIDSLLALKRVGGGGLPDIVSQGAGAGANTAADLRADLEKQLAGFTETLVDDAIAATERFRDEMGVKLAALSGDERAALQQLVDQVLAAMEARTLLLRAAEGIRTTPRVVGGGAGSIPLRTDYSASDKRMAERTKELAEAEETLADARREALQEAARQAQAIEEAGRGVLQLAESMGLLSDQAAEAAEAVLQIASSAKQLSALPSGAGFAAMLPGILSIAGGLSSLIGSLFGESPEEAARREVQRANTEAIKQLSSKIGELGEVLGDTAGSEIADIRQAILNAFASPNRRRPAGGVLYTEPDVQGELEKLGLTLSDLQQLAAELHITLRDKNIPSFEELQAILDALAKAEFTQFATTLTGQLQALALEFELFDITDPIEQLKKLQDIAKRFGTGDPRKVPQVLAALGAIDLSTEAGRAAADKEIQRIFELLKSGGLDESLLGDFSVQQLLDFLREFEGLLDSAASDSAPQGETQGFAVSRTITEAQGSLVISQLGTVAYWQEQLYRLLDMRMLQPPSIIPGVPAGASISLTIYQSFERDTTVAEATRVGDAAADALLKRMNEELGASLRTRKLLSGNVSQV